MLESSAPVEAFDEIDSTLLEARRRAERGEPGPVWLVARTQTAGRGRRGRAWASLEGNLLATYLFASTQPPRELALLGFAAGVAISEAVEAMLGSGRAALKWPNDVLVDGEKIAGILIESGRFDRDRVWVALAFGVNLAAAPAGLDQPTTSLRAHLPPDAPAPEPEAFLARLRPRLEYWSQQLIGQEGFEPLRQAWLARAYAVGRQIRVTQGDASHEGRMLGISSYGELELDVGGERRLIAAGDVMLSEG
jgi:BirA family biotin operon repressor/biotin-[acetyl-CoA-carboxylase] ligase